MKLSGIDPATFWLVAQSLKQLRRSVLIWISVKKGKSVPLQASSGPEGSVKLRCLYPQKILLVLISVKILSRPQGHSAIGRILRQWKIPMTPPGIEPTTFRFVGQHLNHCATAVPIWISVLLLYFTELIKFCSGNVAQISLVHCIFPYRWCKVFLPQRTIDLVSRALRLTCKDAVPIYANIAKLITQTALRFFVLLT